MRVRSTTRARRLLVPSARTEEALVRMAGATTAVKTAKGLPATRLYCTARPFFPVGDSVRRIVGNTQVAEDRERLRGKGFVQFDDVHLRKLETSFPEDFAHCRGRTHAHDAGSHACGRGGDDAGLGRKSMTFCGCLG